MMILCILFYHVNFSFLATLESARKACLDSDYATSTDEEKGRGRRAKKPVTRLSSESSSNDITPPPSPMHQIIGTKTDLDAILIDETVAETVAEAVAFSSAAINNKTIVEIHEVDIEDVPVIVMKGKNILILSLFSIIFLTLN